ncbi:SUKH-3 domain-containing protein, partial [Deinococcus sp. HMF7604]|uniref:SUKH-3 domain-containing protein n=1 Tax=Deinococcus betulae TaxID=2873312 RepID=UPI001CCF1801
MQLEFSELARRAFEQGGWFEGRRVDLTDVFARMERQGWTVFDAARSFLEQVHGLTISDTVFQCEHIADRWEVRSAERLTLTPLFPIGMESGWLPYFIDATGRFYWLDSDLAMYASLDDFLARRQSFLLQV